MDTIEAPLVGGGVASPLTGSGSRGDVLSGEGVADNALADRGERGTL